LYDQKNWKKFTAEKGTDAYPEHMQSGTDTYPEHTSQELMPALIVGKKFEKVPSKHAEYMRYELMPALSIRIRN
jgi:hypothetical protein